MAVTISSAQKEGSIGKNAQRIVEALDSVPNNLLSCRLIRKMVDRSEEAELVKQSKSSVIGPLRATTTYTNPSRLLVIVPSISKYP
jgi:hypothetical protein